MKAFYKYYCEKNIIKKDKKIEINGKIPEPWSKCDDKEAFIHFIKTVDSQKDKKYNTLFEFELDSWSAK